MIDLETCKNHLKQHYTEGKKFQIDKETFELLKRTFGHKLLEQARKELNLPVFPEEIL